MKKYNSILGLHHNTDFNPQWGKGEDLKSLWVDIPDFCHLHCEYCYASTDNSPKNGSEDYLKENDYERLLKEFSQMGGEFVGIPGKGEPFHEKNYTLTKKIIDACDNYNLKLAIFTTGDALFFKPSSKISDEPDYTKLDYIKDKDNIVLLIKYNSDNPDIQNKLVGGKNKNYAALRDRSIEILINKYHLNAI